MPYCCYRTRPQTPARLVLAHQNLA
uniref:Uncharacterized protein n=1 Tax=Arundo donax TaxID=35708 RepID=A0A0A8ZL52_ARUDO